MSNYRGTDTFPIAAGAAVGGAAVVGIAAGTGQAVGGFINDYRWHIANGGSHVPEVLLVPLALLGFGVSYLIGLLTLAGVHPEIAADNHWNLTETLLFWALAILATWIWIALVGGIFAATISAGKGAVFNAVAPIAFAVGYALYTGPTYTGTKAFLIWLGIRILCAGLTQFPAYRTLRITALGIPAAVMVLMTPYLLLSNAGYLPALSLHANTLIAQTLSFAADDHSAAHRYATPRPASDVAGHRRTHS